MSNHDSNLRIAVIGGGPGGLMTTYLLNRQKGLNAEVTLFEASPRLGGKLLTESFRLHPALFEAGAAELYDYSRLGPDPLRELVYELGLQTRPMHGGAAIFRDRILPTPGALREAWGPNCLRAWEDFNRAAKHVISPANYYESDWRADGADPLGLRRFDEMLATIPDPVAREYVRIMVHSDLACEPHQTNAAYGLQNHLMDDDAYMGLYSIVGGNEGLTRRLAEEIVAEVRTNQPVLRVEQCANGYRVVSRKGGKEESADFNNVIVALPNNWLPEITWADEPLRAAMEQHHRRYDHPAHYLRVTALFDRPFWRGLVEGSYFMSDAFGGCCLYDESSRLPAGDGRGVLSWLLAGNAALNLANLSDADIASTVLAHLPPRLGPGRPQAGEVQVHRWLNSVNALPGGFPPIDPDLRHQPDAVRCPGLYVVGDYLFDSTLNGVLDSAGTAVELLLDDHAAIAIHAG